MVRRESRGRCRLPVLGLALAVGLPLTTRAQDAPARRLPVLQLGTPRFLHRGLITAVAYSPDGTLLATGGQDQTIRLWEAATGNAVRTIAFDQPNWPVFVVFSPDGKHLSASNGRAFGVWEVKTGKELHRGANLPANVNRLIASSDGRVLATRGYREPFVRLWDVPTGTGFRTIEAPGDYDPALAFSPDGRRVVVAQGYKARLYAVATGRMDREFDLNPTAPCPSGAGFSPDGKVLAIGCMNRTVHLWEVATGRELPPLTRLPGPPYALAFVADGGSVVTSDGYHLQIWDLATRRVGLQVEAGYAFAVSPDGKTLATAGGHALLLWRTADGTMLPTGGHSAPLQSLAYAPDGKLLATADGVTLRLWDARSGQGLRTIVHSVSSVTFSADGKRIAGWGTDGRPVVWDVATGRERPLFRPEGSTSGGGEGSIRFAPDGSVLAACGQQVELWRLDTGKPLVTRPRETVLCLAYAPDSRTLAVGSAQLADPWKAPAQPSTQARIRLWDVRSGRLLHTLRLAAPPVQAVFAPGGRYLASLSTDGRLRLWDVTTGTDLERFPGRLADPFSLSARDGPALNSDGGNSTLTFLSDGRRLAVTRYQRLHGVWDVRTGRPLFQTPENRWTQLSGDGEFVALSPGDPADRALHLVRVATGKEVGSVPWPDELVSDFDFSPDGEILAVAGDAGTVELWDVPTPARRVRFAAAARRADLRREHTVVAFSRDGRTVAIGAAHEGVVVLRATDTGRVCRTLRLHAPTATDAGLTLQFAPDGRTLLTDGLGATALWDMASGRQLFTRRSGRSSAFTPGGERVIFHEHNGPSHVYETATGKEVRIKGLYEPLALSPDGQRLAAPTWDGHVFLWDLATATDVGRIGSGRGGPPADVALLPDGGIVAASWEDGGQVNVWDVRRSRSLRRIRLESPQAEPPRTHRLALAPDGKALVAWDLLEGRLRFWDIASGKETRRIDVPLGVERASLLRRLPGGPTLTFSRDGRRLFGVYDRRGWFCWDVATGKELLCRRIPERDAPPLGFAPDGKYLVEPTRGAILVRDVATGKVAYRLEGFPAPWLYAAAFSADGRRLAVGSGTTAVVWDLVRD